jgi:hypothetical protein
MPYNWLDEILSLENYLLAPKLTPYTFSSPNLGNPHTQHIIDGRSLELFANYNSYMLGYSMISFMFLLTLVPINS